MPKVILTHEVSGLGRAGDIVEVKQGYARNYLLPEGYATAWTKGGQKQVDQIRAAREAKAIATHDQALALRERLQAGPVKVGVKAGKEGKLFGSVTRADIAQAVADQGLGSVDHRTIDIPHAIKRVGEHQVTITLADGVVAGVTVSVVPSS